MENEEMKNKDDFTVVLQPFSDRLTFPLNQFNTTDLSYIGPDCFHLSQKGYARCENIIIYLLIVIFMYYFDRKIYVISICKQTIPLHYHDHDFRVFCISVANALWNNMMEPVGQKTIDWSKELERFICPTDEFPYIRTWKNSMP